MKSLIVYQNGNIIYEHEGKWLHPLLDFELFLKEHPKYDPSTLKVHDKIVGKASAMLTARLGIKHVHAVLLSSLAKQIFEKNNIAYTYDEIIDKLPCKTEVLLQDVTSLDKAHEIIILRSKKQMNN